jgi:hypothetical protein
VKSLGISPALWAIIVLLIVIAGGATYLVNAHQAEVSAEQAEAQWEALRVQAMKAEADRLNEKEADEINNESSFDLLNLSKNRPSNR